MRLTFLRLTLSLFLLTILSTSSLSQVRVKNKGHIKNTVIGSKNKVSIERKDTIIGRNANDNDNIVQFELEGNNVKIEIDKYVNIEVLVLGKYNTINVKRVFYSIGKSIEYEDLKRNVDEFRNQLAAKNKELEIIESLNLKEVLNVERLQISAQLNKAEERLKNFIDDVLNLAEMLSTIPFSSDRLNLAKEFFYKGEFKKAYDVLNAKKMQEEGDNLLIQQKRDSLALAIISNEFSYKALLKVSNYSDSLRYDSAVIFFEQSLKYAKTVKNLREFAYLLGKDNRTALAISYFKKALQLPCSDTSKADLYFNLGNLYSDIHNAKESEVMYRQSVEIYERLSQDDSLKYKIFVTG